MWCDWGPTATCLFFAANSKKDECDLSPEQVQGGGKTAFVDTIDR